MKVLIASPIRQKPAIINEFLASLERLEKKSFDLDYFFIDDNDQKESKELLQKFSHCTIEQAPRSASSYVCNEVTHHWKDSMIWKVGAWKDGMIQKAREQNYDYLFLIDSDLVLHPHTIEQLIAAKKEIVSNIFWTKWQPDQIALPQVWISDHYTLFEHEIQERLSNPEIMRRQNEFLNKLKKPGIYEVGGLGACTLIARSALEKDISFRRISNISFWGEDRHFCIRAAAIGLKLFVDTHYPAYHIYRDSDLAGVEAFKRKNEA